MASKRERSQANPLVSESDYEAALVKVSKIRPWHAMIGPEPVSAVHQVLPFHIIAAHSWLDALIEIGCWNAVIWPSRFEYALRRQSSKLPAEYNVEQYIAQATDHMRMLMGLLREHKLEDLSPCAKKRRKTGTFRRACTNSDYIVVNALLAKLRMVAKLDGRLGRCSAVAPAVSPVVSVLSAHRPSAAASPVVPVLDLPAAHELDARGYPLIFAMQLRCVVA